MRTLTRASLRYYLPTNIMVVVGVAAAVAVLAGALLVGASVRASLQELALGRLGATDLVITSPTFFRTALADAMASADQAPAAAPLIVSAGAVVHDTSKRTAGRVAVYGIDDRFGRFHGVEGFAVADRGALISPALAAELGAAAGDALTIRIAKPSDIPLSTLQGRRELIGDRIRVTVARVLVDSPLREFSLAPSQGPVLAVFVPLSRLQRDLELGDRVNTIIVKAGSPSDSDSALAALRTEVSRIATAEDAGVGVRTGQASTEPLIVEGRSGFLTPAAVTSLVKQATDQGRAVVPVLTYVANAVRIGDRAVPYSTVSAIDLAPDTASSGSSPPIWLNQWAADDLDARVGDAVTLDYYLWNDSEGLQTRSASFTLHGILPMRGPGADTTLTPDYPGISDAPDISSWDPPFPVDLSQVRKKDEDYWDTYRAAPKAIVSLADGQRLWGSRFGNVSSLRITGGTGTFAPAVDPFAAGWSVRHVRAEAIAASMGTTDFGEYFLYFSFFIVVSALLLAYLFFALGLEQRTREVGVLSALGFSLPAVQRSFVREGVVLSAIGAVVGAAAAVGYGALIMHGLRTWWVGAVGTTALTLHVEPLWLAVGVAGALASGLLALSLGVRALRRRSTRSLLSGDRASSDRVDRRRRSRLNSLAATLFIVAGAALFAASLTNAIDATAGFFGAGGAWLVAGLCVAGRLFAGRAVSSKAIPSLARLGIGQTSAAPRRSVLSLALIAFACFVLVTVGAFQKDANSSDAVTAAGVGGYSLMAESIVPLMYDPNSPAGRIELGFEADDASLGHAQVTRFRLRPGDEASCLTLYQPTNPRIIAPEPRFFDRARFTFASSLATTAEEKANPWRLLDRRFDDGAIPAIADQTTLTYALHLAVGDDFVFTPEGHTEIRLRIVGALADSVLQSELIIGEAAFVRRFPRNEGYRVWLIEAPASESAALTAYLEDRLADFGVDVVNTRQRLASYHQVENTYLATFEALGGLGLLLGTIGLGAVLARNVLERRRELALLSAVGFTPANLRVLVLSESAALVVGGVALGTISALVAIFPALRDRAQTLPLANLAMLLSAVIVVGLAASLVAVKLATSVRVIDVLKSE